MHKTIAVVFDFDDTLAHDSTTDFLVSLGVNTKIFWGVENKKLLDDGWDTVPSYMYQMIEWSKNQVPEKRITKKKLEAFGKKVHFFDGVQSFFTKLSEFVKKTDPTFTVEFYIISSGLGDLIKNCKIAKYMNDIFTSDFHYNNSGEIECPKKVVSYTDKTRYIFQISKGLIGSEFYNQPFAVNKKVDASNLRIPLHNMIFIGDGLTDVPCFALLNQNRGIAFAVYDQGNEEQKHKAWGFIEEGRVRNLLTVNYKKGSDLLNSVEMAIGGIITKAKGAYQE